MNPRMMATRTKHRIESLATHTTIASTTNRGACRRQPPPIHYSYYSRRGENRRDRAGRIATRKAAGISKRIRTIDRRSVRERYARNLVAAMGFPSVRHIFLSVLLATIEAAAATEATRDALATNHLRHGDRFHRRAEENRGSDRKHDLDREPERKHEAGTAADEAVYTDTHTDCSAAPARDGMSPRGVRRSAIAAELSRLAYELGEDPLAAKDSGLGFETAYGSYHSSGIDAVYSARIGSEYCAVAFRGTDSGGEDYRSDLLSNLSVGPVGYGNEDSHSCEVHSGFHEAYYGFEHRSEGVEAFLETCLEGCPGCEVLLTGHSQGGSIAEVAALYYLRGENNATPRSDKRNPAKVHVVTFGAPQALGAGCLPLFSREERCNFLHYVMTTEGSLGRGLVYDPVPMLSHRALVDRDNDGTMDASWDTYARNGGLAFVGFEVFVSAEDPSSVLFGALDAHYPAPTGALDWSIDSHNKALYAGVLAEQAGLYPPGDLGHVVCHLPTDGLAAGAPCNPAESGVPCGTGECAAGGSGGWWNRWWPTGHTCAGGAGAADRFCHERPPEWTFVGRGEKGRDQHQ
ncbi:unnamed protein product [Pseudo-nitzschia multistriata]|uniref:Fungal lipase-type domain-containing protein n=1 Tax=Pseudo-nitzschia multistriata TaxID=183589 RepID=A0A448Z6F7_9STRA|nr:unnamed protein product [Pseudo-nitzschia multistriata]